MLAVGVQRLPARRGWWTEGIEGSGERGDDDLARCLNKAHRLVLGRRLARVAKGAKTNQISKMLERTNLLRGELGV